MSTLYEKARVVNDDYRDAAFNRRYYSCRLSTAKARNLTLDVIVAVGTSGAIAAWNVWQDGPGTYVWKVLVAVATLVAVVKPFLNLPKEIERYSELVAGWAALYYDLEQLTIDMRTSGHITDNTWASYSASRKRLKDLGIRDDPDVNVRLRDRCYEDVMRQIPAESLWWPDEEQQNVVTRQITEAATT